MTSTYARTDQRSFPLALAGACCLLSLAACSGQQQGGFAWPPTPVEMATVAKETVVDQFEAVGTIEAINSVTIVSEINALVMELPFPEGSSVGKGAVIARLDDSQIAAELRRAEATRNQKQAAYDRAKGLKQTGAITSEEYDDALANLEVAKADVAITEARLAKTRIVAPFSGMIGARKVSPGAFLNIGRPITDLAQLSELKVTFAAPERFFPRLQKGAKVSVTTPAYPDYQLTGVIKVIEPMVDQATRSARIIAHVSNPDNRFRPGMSANVAAVLDERPGSIVIPSEAVFAEGAATLVYVIQPDSSVMPSPVQLGSRLRSRVEILSGLTEGQQIVQTGQQKLFPGAKVIPIPFGGGAPAPGESPNPADAVSSDSAAAGEGH